MPTDRTEPTLPNLVCNQASLEEIQTRLDQVSDVDEVDFKGWSGLHWALVREVPEVISLLLESGADPNLATGVGHTPLNIALRSGQADAVTMLLAAGADASRADVEGKTPRMVAMAGKFPGLVKLLPEGS